MNARMKQNWMSSLEPGAMAGLRLFAVLLFAVSAATTNAATVTWGGATTGSQGWFVPGNWNPARVPGPDDDVLILGNVEQLEVLVRGAVSVKSLSSAANIRVIGDVANFSRINAAVAITNRGQIRLESDRSDRSAVLQVNPGGVIVNTGRIRAVAANGGERGITASIVNRGEIITDSQITLSINNGDRELAQLSGFLGGDGNTHVLGGRVRFVQGTVTRSVRLFSPDLNVESTMNSSSGVTVMGSESRLRSLDSSSFTLYATTDVGNFTTLRGQSNALNSGRILLEPGRSDREMGFVFSDGYKNTPTGVIEIRRGESASVSLSGKLINQGSVICSNHVTTFQGTYEADGGRVDGDVLFQNATIIQTTPAAELVELKLYGGSTLLKGNNPQTSRLRVISDSANFSTLTVESNRVNHGIISLESLSSGRTTVLAVDGSQTWENRGTIQIPTTAGGKVLRGGLRNLGQLVVHTNEVLECELQGRALFQEGGSIEARGLLNIRGGALRLLSGTVSGTVQAFNTTHFAAQSFAGPAQISVLGLESRLISNESERVTYLVTSDVGNFTTFSLLANANNRGRILLSGGRSDRGTKIQFSGFNTNLITGRIEVVLGADGGTRQIEGSLVNQGLLIATNSPCGFTGIYQSDGGRVEGGVRFQNSTITALRDVDHPMPFLLYGENTLGSDNPPNHLLRVIADVGNFSSLFMASNVINQGTIRLESERSDRTSFLRSRSGVVRNGARGLVHAISTNGGGREIVGSFLNQGVVIADNNLRLSGVGAAHRNVGILRLGSSALNVGGASFVNETNGRIYGGSQLDASGLAFTNSGGILPGLSPGRLNFNGTFNQTDSGWIDIEIGGRGQPGTLSDYLNISGRANLGGRIIPRLVDGFLPEVNDEVVVLFASTGVNEVFARTTGFQVLDNRYFEIAYTANDVKLRTREGSLSTQAPVIVVQPDPQEVDPDAPVQFEVVADGVGPFTYQWFFKGNSIPGATTARLRIPAARVQDVGDYNVRVSGRYGSSTSQNARLSLKNQPSGAGGCPNCDFGDAPDSYGTSVANNGASHPNEKATGGPFVMLGATVDLEADSLGNANASLDDITPAGGDDENGVTFTTPVEAGKTNEVRVSVVKSGYELAYLTAWLDTGDDGNFNSASDLIIPTREVSSGINTIRFFVPAGAVAADTISRFRLVGVNSSNDPRKNVGPTGQANNGEVEDHPVTITRGTTGEGEPGQTNRFDFGDAPDTYRTTLAANGPRHRTDMFIVTNALPVVTLGAVIDLETDGAPTQFGTGDDLATAVSPDDEEGVFFLQPLHPGLPTTVQVFVNSRGFTNRFLNAWIDFGADGTFTNSTDRIASGLLVGQGTNTISFVVPATAIPTNTMSRFRITAANELNSALRVLDPFGFADNGEVEDHGVSVTRPLRDFGDAPESQGSFATTLARNGPRHVLVQGMFLGKRIDVETDGRPTAQAKGDDNVASDDEDGVVFTGPLTPGGVVRLEVTASVAGKLEGWIDFNNNRSWLDAGELIFNSVNVSAGLNIFAVNVPNGAALADVFARFRYSTRGVYGLLGEAPDGEVEDYVVTIEPPNDCELTCSGSDFWLAYPGNQFPDPAFPLLPQLRLLGTAGTAVTVSIPGLETNINAVIAANGVANVVLPLAVDLGALNDAVLNRGIHVTSGKPVSVYAVSRVQYSSDGYLGLPTDVLGKEYVVGAFPNLHVGIPELSGSQFVITATTPNTTVTITPASETGVRVAKIPYVLTLTNAGDCYQLRNTNDAPADLSGTIIESDQPVAVFGGHQNTDVNSSSLFFSDYLVEQIPPVNRLGTEFFTAPFFTRSGGDTVQVVAARDQTTLVVDGSPVVLTNKGDVYLSLRTDATWITADKPVYAAQFASSSDLDGVTNADPFMVTIPGRSLFTRDHTFVTAGINFAEHYINVIAPTLTTSLTLDGTVTNPVFTAIGSSGYHYARMKVAQGVHTLSAGRAIGVTVYGWSQYESYGWPACLFFGDTIPPVVRTPTNQISRTLPANENTCVVTLPDLRQGTTVTDNCELPADVIITQSPPAGTVVGVGTNKVTLSTRDAAGNLGTATIDYVVTDRTGAGNYSIMCPADLRVRCEGTNGSVVNFEVKGTRGCTPVIVESIPASGSLFPIGTTTVVGRIVVGGVIQAECRFTVSVSCQKRIQLLRPSVPVGEVVRQLSLDFDAGENIVEVADSISGPWIRIPNAQPGMVIQIAEDKGKFYRIR